MRFDQLSVGEIWLKLRDTQDAYQCPELQAKIAKVVFKTLYPTPRTPKRDAGGKFASRTAADAAKAEAAHVERNRPHVSVVVGP